MTTTKIDLDELERKARKAHDLAAVLEASPTHMTNQHDHAMAAWDYHVAATPGVMLALVARIRELEVVAKELIDAYDGEGYPSAAVKILEILEKGVVLP